MNDKMTLTLPKKEALQEDGRERLPTLVSLTISEAKGLAGRLKFIIEECAIKLGGKKYIKVEGWKSIAAEDGCCPEIQGIEWLKADPPRPSGVRARAVLKRMSDGAIITAAYGFCGDDEDKWKNKAQYAKEGMAQTRALSRACKHRYDYVIVLLGKEYSSTPAEEVVETEYVTVEGKVLSAKAATAQKLEGSIWLRVVRVSDLGKEDALPAVIYTFDKPLGAELLALEGKICSFQVKPGEKYGRVINWQELEPAEAEGEVE